MYITTKNGSRTVSGSGKCSKTNPTGTPYQCLKTGFQQGSFIKKKVNPSLSLHVIRDIARSNNVRGYTHMSKAGLLQALALKDVDTYQPVSLG